MHLYIDGMDITQWLRLSPGEGFDPADPDFITPQFGEATSEEGDPLLSIHSGNKELVWPVHLSSSVGKDELHTLVRQINRIAQHASVIEWQDDAATKPTFYDAIIGRFEPDFNYRRGQRNWLSGVLRVWTKPYGHTGTYRNLGTAAATVALPAVSAPSVAGDVDALLDCTISMAPAPGTVIDFGPRRIIMGAMVLASGALPVIRAASNSDTNLTGTIGQPAATLVGGSGAFASQYLRQALPTVGEYGMFAADLVEDFGHDMRTPLRMFALARMTKHAGAAATGNQIAMHARGGARGDDHLYGPTQILDASMGWRVLDLGLIPDTGFDSVEIETYLRIPVIYAGVMEQADASRTAQIAGVVLVPENNAIMAVGTTFVHGPPTMAFLESLGVNHFNEFGTGVTQLKDIVDDTVRGRRPRLKVGTAQQIHGFAFTDKGPHNTQVRLGAKVRERFTYAR